MGFLVSTTRPRGHACKSTCKSVQLYTTSLFIFVIHYFFCMAWKCRYKFFFSWNDTILGPRWDPETYGCRSWIWGSSGVSMHEANVIREVPVWPVETRRLIFPFRLMETTEFPPKQPVICLFVFCFVFVFQKIRITMWRLPLKGSHSFAIRHCFWLLIWHVFQNAFDNFDEPFTIQHDLQVKAFSSFVVKVKIGWNFKFQSQIFLCNRYFNGWKNVVVVSRGRMETSLLAFRCNSRKKASDNNE